MRSRYTAYVRGDIDYLVRSHHATTRDQIDIAAVSAWSRETHWLGLEIVATERGGPRDTAGIVEFVARGVTRGQPFAQRERSRFERVDLHWYYVDGNAVAAPRRAAVTPGRNDPCPCGSGIKFKRCHGASR